MASPKSIKSGSVVAPADPPAAVDAIVADPGEVSAAKAAKIESEDPTLAEQKAEPFKPPKEGEATETETAWIEVELVGEDDKPISGERYRVTLPDGRVSEGTLDHRGWARVAGFETGSCKITFPDLDKDAWEFIESVGPMDPDS